MIFEVLGDALETLSAMKAAKVALERCSTLPFCRFCEIFEILRVPLGGNLGSKIPGKGCGLGFSFSLVGSLTLSWRLVL